MRARGTHRAVPLSATYAALVFVFLCAAAAAVGYVTWQSSHDAVNGAKRTAASGARSTAATLGDDITLLRTTVGQLAANPSLAALHVPANRAACTLTIDGTGNHLEILDASGRVLCSSRKQRGAVGFAHASWLHTATTKPLLRAPVLDPVTGHDAILDTSPAVAGLVVASFTDLRGLAADLRRTLTTTTGPELIAIARSSRTVVLRAPASSQFVGRAAPARLLTGDTEQRDVAGTERIYGAATVPGTDWQLLVGIDRARALAPAVRLRNREVAILLAALALILVVTIVFYRRTAAPIKELSSRVRATAARPGEEPLPIRGPAEVRAVAAQINDLTAAVNAQEAVRRARDDAERANEAKTRFLSHMSHELRTPLAAILGFAELLQRHKEPEERDHEWAGYILEGGRHLLSLVNELLEISRIEAGRLTLALGPVRVREVVDAVTALVTPLAEAQGVTIVRAPDSDDDAVVIADSLRLKQVLLNVVSNAIKYNRPGGTVTVSFRQSRSTVDLAIADTGAGMDEEQVKRLFTPFERLGAESTPISGSGLGLVVTKGLVDAMDGSLTVESERGRGSTFTIALPAAAEAEVAPADVPVPVADSGDVLYVDDAEENLRLVADLLATSRPGLEVRTARRGDEATELAKEHRPNVLLLDLNLPDIPGEEVLRRLRARPETVNVPVVVLSADSTSRNITRLLESGAEAYLTKPLNVPQLLHVVDRLLAGSR